MADDYQFEKYYLAKVVNPQINPNKPKNEDWENMDNALTKTYDTYAVSQFSAKYNSSTKKTLYNRPYDLTAHDFDLNLPSNAYLKEVQFIAHLKADNGLTAIRPTAHFNLYGGAVKKGLSGKASVSYSSKDGWYSGSFRRYPVKDLPNQWLGHTYTIYEDDLVKGEISVKELNASIMGIDLLFDYPRNQVKKDTDWNVYCAYVEIRVRYDLPKYALTYTSLTSEEDAKVGNPYVVKCVFTNSSKANDGIQTIDVNIPFGNEVESYVVSQGNYDSSTSKWTVDTSKKAELTLTLTSFVSGDNTLVLSNDNIGEYPYTFYVGKSPNGVGASDIQLALTDSPHKNHRMCIIADVIGQSETGSVKYVFTNDKTYQGKGWELVERSDGVTVSSTDSDSITLSVPVGEDYTCKFRYCYYPKVTGDNVATVKAEISNVEVTSSDLPYKVFAPYVYRINNELSDKVNNAYLHPQSITFQDHRVISDIEFNSFYLTSSVNSKDSLMKQSECGLKMYAQRELDYIGCIPLEHSHFDPKSTYKDTLIDTHYKNKRYMGKKLATDEDITLNVRLHPKQVTTLQGLIQMDKPIPINTNHRSFESDSLNHRGWAEVYGVKTSYTNPHWYKCDIDVKYLTHNLNTRFHIEKGVKIATYDYPALMRESIKSGTSLENDYWIVDTDGSFSYNDDEDADDNTRNLLSLSNGQGFRIKSSNILPNSSMVSFNWLTTLVDEERENNISRIVRLIDSESNNIVFEYQYDNFSLEYGDETITCSTIARLWDGVGWDTSTDVDISLWLDTSIMSEEIETDDDSLLYGSNLHFNVENNKLNIIEEGFNGRESYRYFELKGSGKYYYEIDVKNNNTDAETDAVDFYVDMNVMDTVLTSDYAEKYSKLYVSPFPVADKKIVFTRQGEEGSLYYLEDDGEEFSYLINPYYQYKNGTDLVYDGESIFDLNYGYEVVFIQNGLVRLGFNRLNGRLYLGKYDPKSKQYINLYRFHLKKYEDININNISDDKIEIQASDSTFTIYRGHPYIVVKHPTEDIWLDTGIGTVWAEKVGGNSPTELPSYWDLMNNSNLLQEDVASKKGITTSNVTIEEVEVSDRENSTLSIADIYDGTTHYSDIDDVPFEVNTDYIFTLDGEINVIGEDLPIEYQTYDGEFGTYTLSTIVDKSETSSIVVYPTKNVIMVSDTLELQGTVLDDDGDGISGKTVYFYESYVPLMRLFAELDKIQTDDTLDLNCKLRDAEDGNPVIGAKVHFFEMYIPIYDLKSDANLIQTSDTLDLSCKLKDNDGNKVIGEKVYFYIKTED